MRRFVEANVREQLLGDAVRGVLLSDQVHELTPGLDKSPHRSRWRSVTIVASLAASLLVTLILFPWNERGGQTIETFVSVAAIDQSDSERHAGDRLGPGTIELQRGRIRLQFDDGVEVTLQGPARYEFIELRKTRLHTGLLTAMVPPGTEGFLVSTPMAEVIDLGAAFGIELDAKGLPNVSVFDGKVEVTPIESGDKRLVQEGEAVRVTQRHEIQATEFDAATFEKVWPVASGVSGSTGAFQFAPQWPRRMGLVQSNTDIFVLPEGYANTLSEPLRVNVTIPGEYRDAMTLTSAVVPVGTRVKSFLLQFRPTDQRGETGPPQTQPSSNELKRIVGEITFDRPILGLIVVGDDLRASDGLFSVRGGQVPQKGRALELGGTPRDDIVTLGEDRRTVKLDLAAFGVYADQVRVIVDQSLQN